MINDESYLSVAKYVNISENIQTVNNTTKLSSPSPNIYLCPCPNQVPISSKSQLVHDGIECSGLPVTTPPPNHPTSSFKGQTGNSCRKSLLWIWVNFYGFLLTWDFEDL